VGVARSQNRSKICGQGLGFMPSSRGQKPNLASPDTFFITPPQPPVDLGSIQRDIGGLAEAVKTLKEQVKEQSTKLDKLRDDVTSAKAVSKTLIWVISVVGPILGIILGQTFGHWISGSAK
jgi:hypothetical protein